MNRDRVNLVVLATVLLLILGCSASLREPAVLWSEGTTAFREKDFVTAADRFLALLCHPQLPTNTTPRVLYWKARTHLELEQFTEAYRCLKDLTWEYPRSIEAKWAVGVGVGRNLRELTDWEEEEKTTNKTNP